MQHDRTYEEIVSSAWATTILHSLGVEYAAIEEWQRQIHWLRTSLEADLAPQWLIDMVLERWPLPTKDEI